MTIRAKVIFRRDGKDVWSRGAFSFLQLPAKGDRFTLKERGGVRNADGTPDPDGTEDDFEVLYVEHFPFAMGPE